MKSQTTRPSGRFCQWPGRKAHWTSLGRDRRRQPGQPHKGWVWDALAQQPSSLNRDHMSRGWSIQSSLWAAADLSVWEREGDAQVWEPSSDPFPATLTPTSAQSCLTGLLAVLELGWSSADQKKVDLHSGDRLRVTEGPQPGATAQCSVKTVQERYLIKALLFIAITCRLVFQCLYVHSELNGVKYTTLNSCTLLQETRMALFLYKGNELVNLDRGVVG